MINKQLQDGAEKITYFTNFNGMVITDEVAGYLKKIPGFSKAHIDEKFKDGASATIQLFSAVPKKVVVKSIDNFEREWKKFEKAIREIIAEHNKENKDDKDEPSKENVNDSSDGSDNNGSEKAIPKNEKDVKKDNSSSTDNKQEDKNIETQIEANLEKEE